MGSYNFEIKIDVVNIMKPDKTKSLIGKLL